MKLVNDFEKAVRKDEMAGGDEPLEMDEKRKEYRRTKKELLNYLKELEARGEAKDV